MATTRRGYCRCEDCWGHIVACNVKPKLETIERALLLKSQPTARASVAKFYKFLASTDVSEEIDAVIMPGVGLIFHGEGGCYDLYYFVRSGRIFAKNTRDDSQVYEDCHLQTTQWSSLASIRVIEPLGSIDGWSCSWFFFWVWVPTSEFSLHLAPIVRGFYIH